MNEISCNVKSKRHDYNDMINFVVNKYGINDIQFSIFEETRTVDRFSTNDLEIEAILVSYPNNTFAMYIRPGHLQPGVLFHELVHLWQYYRGDLVAHDNFKRYTWKGKDYDKTTEYSDRPWEKEAFLEQSKLYKEYKKYKKSQKKSQK